MRVLLKLKSPVIITPRLMPGLQIHGSFISINRDPVPTDDGRDRYQYYLDIDGQEYRANDLSSGVGGGTLQEGLQSLLSFLSAAADAYAYQMRSGRNSENSDLFPEWVNEWTYENSDDISMLAVELEETKLIEEEHHV